MLSSVNLLIKPASGLCNIRCKYCFYYDLAKEHRFAHNIMSRTTADRLIDRAEEAADRDISFAFQGGEPTLAGLDFFRYFVEQAKARIAPHKTVRYSIQTNGMLIDDNWAAFLAEHHFLVGVSLDGPADMHNMHRVDTAGQGTHRRIMAAVHALERAGAEFNILTVITANAARHARSLYAWLRKQGFRYLQFIACLDPLKAARGSEKYSLTPEKYGAFLCELFDLWYTDWKRGNYCSIRLFDDYVHIAAGMSGGTCATSGKCGGYLVVESDGSVYPCDFYVTADWGLGSLFDQSLEKLLNSSDNRRFIAESAAIPADCPSCPFFTICRGGCRRDRQLEGGVLGDNYLCPAFRRLFSHALPRIQEMAQAEKRALQGRQL